MMRPLALAVMAALAQAQFASRVDLVEVYATTATSRDDRAVLDLTASEFEVLEDGRPQRVEVFAAGDFPLAVALALDRSFSMAGARLAMAKSAGHVFLGALRPEDRAMLVAIGSRVETLAPLSAERSAQHGTLTGITAWGTTSLHDAVIEAIGAVQPAHGRRALVLLSDGDDRYSDHPAEAVLARARAADVLIYPVAFGDAMPRLFTELAQLTGGRAFHVRRADALAPALASIAEELRGQYLLGYVPDRASLTGPRGWRAIEVRVTRPGVSVRARTGYIGGTER